MRLFYFRKPSEGRIKEFLQLQESLPFSYPEVGGTRGDDVPGYSNDHNRRCLGRGRSTYEKAKESLGRWAMFDMPWIRLCWPDSPIEESQTVAVVARVMGMWVLNATRIVYVLDERGDVERFGFAYGTLPGHVEMGEERFTVEWHRANDSVWYDIRAFSRPRSIPARMASPYARLLQKRFVRGSMEAMRKAVDAPAG